MPTILLALVTSVLFIAVPCTAPAAPLKTYIAEFSVSGTPDREDLRVALQGILASRLNRDQVTRVESAAKAELLLSGSYALFGKIFSLDVLIKQTANGAMTNVFEQGEGQDDLLPAMGRLAGKINRELAGIPATADKVPPLPTPPAVLQQSAPAQAAAPLAVVKTAASTVIPTAGYVVKPDSALPAGGTTAPLEGLFTSIALGRTLPSGERELFVAGERTIRYLRTGSGMKQVAELIIPVPARILAVDTADLDHDGTPELYVTILDRESLSSRIYRPTDSGLELLADNQPWFFRGIGTDLKDRRIFVQGMDNDGNYYDSISELVKSGNRFETRNAGKLPPQGNIFNFTRFRDAAGVELVAVLDEDSYLVVSTIDGKKLWKSSDKYGGSETSFKHESLTQMRSMGDQYRWTFIEQRIIPLPDGTLLVPHNEGIFSVGNNRSFNKHTLHALKWTGALLVEAWHTRQMTSYLADYAYDPASHEVLLLEVVQKPDLFDKGKTTITINRID